MKFLQQRILLFSNRAFSFECDIDDRVSWYFPTEKREIYVENCRRQKRKGKIHYRGTQIWWARLELSSGAMYIESMDSLSSLMSIKRHYKKDSRYVNDLYTLTYDNHESLYMTNEFLSSLHNTINSGSIDEENVSSLPEWLCVRSNSQLDYTRWSPKRCSPRERLAVVIREFTILRLLTYVTERNEKTFAICICCFRFPLQFLVWNAVRKWILKQTNKFNCKSLHPDEDL